MYFFICDKKGRNMDNLSYPKRHQIYAIQYKYHVIEDANAPVLSIRFFLQQQPDV